MNSFYLWGGESFNLPNEPSSLFFKAGEKITADKMNYILRQNSDFYYRLWNKYNINKFSKSGLLKTDNINNTTQQYLNGQLIESQGVIYLKKENEILPLENCFLTTLKAEILTSSKTGFTLKGRRKNTPISILLFGGGGGGCSFTPAAADGDDTFCAGGGGGHMYYEIINEQIANDIGSFSVTIGKGGKGGSFDSKSVGSNGSNGGATKLTYSLLSNGSQISRQASGGEGAYLVNIETGTYEINKGNVKGGSGGSGGGGAGYFIYAIGQKNTEETLVYVIQNRGGNGTYGGGGGSGCINFNTSKNTSDRSDVTYSTISYLDSSHHPAAGSSGFTFDKNARIHICGGGGGSGDENQTGGYSYDMEGKGQQTGGDLRSNGDALDSNNPNLFPNIEDFKEKLCIIPPIYDAEKKSQGGNCFGYGGGGGGGGYYSIGGDGGGNDWYIGGGGGGGGFGANATGGNGGVSTSTQAGAGGGGGGWGAPGGNAGGHIAGGGGGYGIGGAGGGLVVLDPVNHLKVNRGAGIAAGGHGQSGQGGDGICIIYYYV